MFGCGVFDGFIMEAQVGVALCRVSGFSSHLWGRYITRLGEETHNYQALPVVKALVPPFWLTDSDKAAAFQPAATLSKLYYSLL